MIGATAKANNMTAQPYNPGNDADINTVADQPRALLDMGFEISPVTLRVESGERTATQLKLRQPFEQSLACLCLHAGQIRISEFAAECSAAETWEPSSLLICERDHVNADNIMYSARSASHFESKYDAERAVEPTAVRHAVAV